jgi:hypothetical protein
VIINQSGPMIYQDRLGTDVKGMFKQKDVGSVCFALLCFVLFCFVLFCFVLFCFVLCVSCLVLSCLLFYREAS